MMLKEGQDLKGFLSDRDLALATYNFSDDLKLGEGGFGCVYKGYLYSQLVAAKKLSMF